MFYFAVLAAIIHILFFAMESLLWTNKKVTKAFRVSAADAQTTKLLAFNQGFYNLFLAIEVLLGLHLRSGEATYAMGTAFVLFGLASMIAAGVVLVCSSKQMWRGALIQIIPALIGIGEFLK
ncbi:hypothetical protein D3C72_1491670 [compost metagenome]